MTRPTLLPDPACLRLKLLDASTTTITAMGTMTSPEAECPLCQRRAPRVHSRYVRQVADLPWMGCAVRLELHVRRFPGGSCTHRCLAHRDDQTKDARKVSSIIRSG